MPCVFLLRYSNLLVIFIYISTITIPQATSNTLVNNSSIFSTYNSSSPAIFNSSNKSRIPCFISNVNSDTNNHNPLYWKDKTSSLSIDRFSEVSCLNDAEEPIPGIPDLILNGITYSSIDFQTSLDHKSSVGYAVDKFIFELEQKVMLDKSSNKSETVEASPLVQEQEAQRKEGIAETTREEVLLLTTYWKIYGAMDIALRVLNNQSSAKLLSLSKGPGFVLNFQRARLEGKVREMEFYLAQILRNCLNCTGIEGKRLILLARASGLTKNETLSQAEDQLTSGSRQSQRALDGRWTVPHVFIVPICVFLFLLSNI
ncbi:hypothetical protein PCANC_15797 [Puccinia coronata f. sp. avenae]|uniref:DUF7143 domain-containing protein n=1 Tax=Puccinia coronata f. sp. avenae TaxID=200324 RepID=A0A2N5SYX0_9BASI|nr:hypothetical protein PCANC_15797 [Puccinia coronata f. sp. avenae]